MHFIHTEKKKPTVLKKYNELLEELVILFTEKYGEPKVEVTDEEPFQQTKYIWLFTINEIASVLIIQDAMDETEKYNPQDYAQMLRITAGAE